MVSVYLAGAGRNKPFIEVSDGKYPKKSNATERTIAATAGINKVKEATEEENDTRPALLMGTGINPLDFFKIRCSRI